MDRLVTGSQNNSQNDILRWYLLLWICLAFLWGLYEMSSNMVPAAWNACSTGTESPQVCEQLKQHLGPRGQIEIASLPPPLLGTILIQSGSIFLTFLLFYSILLWVTFSGRGNLHQVWIAMIGQGFIVSGIILFVPALSIAVPVNLILVLILEASAVFRKIKHILVIACGNLILLILTLLIAARQWDSLNENSFNLLAALALLVAGLLFVSGFFVLYMRLTGMHTDLQAAYDELETANKRIETLTRNMERQRMARELHDTLAQGLAGVILQLGAVQANARKKQDQELRESLDQILASARETLASARSAIDELRQVPFTPDNLIKAAKEEVQRFTARSGIPCSMELDLLSQVSPEHVEPIIGVIREGLMNVARHAQAHRAWVLVSTDQQMLHLEIGDDGIGFDLASVDQQAGHYGLLGLQERARLAGGQLAVLSVPGQGTQIHLSLPEKILVVTLAKEKQ